MMQRPDIDLYAAWQSPLHAAKQQCVEHHAAARSGAWPQTLPAWAVHDAPEVHCTFRPMKRNMAMRKPRPPRRGGVGSHCTLCSKLQLIQVFATGRTIRRYRLKMLLVIPLLSQHTILVEKVHCFYACKAAFAKLVHTVLRCSAFQQHRAHMLHCQARAAISAMSVKPQAQQNTQACTCVQCRCRPDTRQIQLASPASTDIDERA